MSMFPDEWAVFGVPPPPMYQRAQQFPRYLSTEHRTLLEALTSARLTLRAYTWLSPGPGLRAEVVKYD